MTTPRFDLLLSYWIFAWFLLFIAGIVKYSPKFIIIIGLVFLFFEIILRKLYDPYYIFVNILIKVIPLVIIINSRIEILPALVVSGVYIIYLYINGKTLNDIYGSKKLTPLTDFIRKITQK